MLTFDTLRLWRIILLVHRDFKLKFCVSLSALKDSRSIANWLIITEPVCWKLKRYFFVGIHPHRFTGSKDIGRSEPGWSKSSVRLFGVKPFPYPFPVGVFGIDSIVLLYFC